MKPLTVEEIADLTPVRGESALPAIDPDDPAPFVSLDRASYERVRSALPRLLAEVKERRARYGDHLGVMEIAHKDGTAAREWIGRVKALLPRIEEAIHIADGGVPLGRNTVELLRELAALIGPSGVRQG